MEHSIPPPDDEVHAPRVPQAFVWDRFRFKKQPYAMKRLLPFCLDVLSGETDCPPVSLRAPLRGCVAVSLHGLLYALIYLYGALRVATPDFLPSVCLREEPEDRLWRLGFSVPLFSLSPDFVKTVKRDLTPAAEAGGFAFEHRVEGEKEFFWLVLHRYSAELFSLFRRTPGGESIAYVIVCAKEAAGLEPVCRMEGKLYHHLREL